MTSKTGWEWHKICCSGCKALISSQVVALQERGKFSCSQCYNDKFAVRCVKCTKIISSGGILYRNEPWHRECLTCTNCGTPLAEVRFTSRQDKPYCAQCFGEIFANKCASCHLPITGISETKCICFEEKYWHVKCFNCAACRISLVGCAFIQDQADIVCTECADLIA